MRPEVATISIEAKAWWSARRVWYNITLFLAAPISGVTLLVVWGLFEERLPCLEITGFTLLFGALLFLIGLAFANICYFLGPLSELIINPHNTTSFRRWVYGIGLAFSLLVIFFPPLINLIAALFGPFPCTDKFGQRYGFDPALVHSTQQALRTETSNYPFALLPA
jgi:hypothetical protein